METTSTAQFTLDAAIAFGPDLSPFRGAASREPTAQSDEQTTAPAGDSDLAWAAKVCAGDADATRALFRRLYPTVTRIIRYRQPRQTSEEDLAQIVFSKIFSKLGQFSGRVPLEHWVSRIVVNTCLTELRAEMARSELRMSDLSQEQEAVVQQLMTSEEDLPGSSSEAARELVQKLLERLNIEERLVITLLHIEEKSVKDISRMTGWSRSATRVKAFRARRRMRRELDNIFSRPARRGITVDEL